MGLLDKRRIVLVGGAGFIGHNLALKLKQEGAEVSIIDNLVHNNYYSLKNNKNPEEDVDLHLKFIEMRLNLLKDNKIPIHRLDSRDYINLTEKIKELNVDTLIHLAAIAHAGKSNKNPYTTFDNSLRTLENTLDITNGKSIKINHFIYFSSSMAYGNFPKGFVTEETPLNPIGIYGNLKLCGERMVIAYNQVFDTPYTIVRPSALYGPRCISKRVGQIFIENAIKGKDLIINGDGSDCLDFTYIEDLTNGIVNVLTHKKALNQTFNLTYGESRSIKQMTEILLEHFPDVNIKYQPRDKLMPHRGALSIEKAKNMIDYKPKYPLEKGFVDYINWYKSIMPTINKYLIS